MLACALDAGREPQDFALLEPGRCNNGSDLRLALGQRAGLVDHQRVDLFHALQRFGVLDQHAGLRAAPDADHDRHRGGKAERTGTGDDEHRNGGDQTKHQAAVPAQRYDPGAEGDESHDDHDAGTNQPAT